MLVLLCSASGPALFAEAEAVDVRGFAKRMFAGIGAEERDCQPDIVREIEARDMNVVCARFPGSFARFELRWDLKLSQDGRSDSRTAGETEAAVQPLTEWEAKGDQYDRIYRVERKAVGVRFTSGDLLLVW